MLRYHDQLAFLTQGGARLAAAHPRVANMLASAGSDPDAERLLEGLAYLSAHVDAQQDTELERLWQVAFQMFFPHYLSPVPAAAIVAFAQQDEPLVLEQGAEVRSLPVEGTPCRFKTCFDVDMGPTRLEEVRWTASRRGGRLTLRLADAVRAESQPDRLRLHLHGEPLVTGTLYQALVQGIVAARWLDASGRVLEEVPTITAEPVGFAEEDALLPYPLSGSPSLRLIQEYAAFPQKFLFVDLIGVWAEAERRAAQAFGLELELASDADKEFELGLRNVRLGCTPVVNVFEHTSDPVLCDQLTTRVSLKPAGHVDHYDVYRPLDVVGYSKKGAQRFRLLGDVDVDEDTNDSVAHIYREENGEGCQRFVSLHTADICKRPESETILVDLLATNGKLPTGLRVGDVKHLAQDSSSEGSERQNASCENITAVTDPADPPTGEQLRRALVTHLALAERPLWSKQGLRDAIRLYNFHALTNAQAAREQTLVADSIQEVESEFVTGQVGRYAACGLCVTISLDQSAFGCEGEAYLFASLLNEVIALGAPLNHFTEVTVRGQKHGKEYRWPRRIGSQLASSASNF